MQGALFHERFEDALDEVVRVCGGRKKVACEAHNLMDACLNPERRERFSPDHVLYIARRGAEAGCHAVMYYLGREIGYDIKPITRAEEVDRLTSVVEQSTKTLASALATLERLQRAA
jgi:predicted hydrocarbon binding protein